MPHNETIPTMKPAILLATLAFLLSGCASPSKRILGVYTDQSTSPITMEQSWSIAKNEAKTRDHFPDEPRVRNKRSKFTTSTSRRINNGGWEVTVMAMDSENRHDGGWGAAFVQEIAPAVVTIDASGKVIHYERFTYEQISEAEKQSRSSR